MYGLAKCFCLHRRKRDELKALSKAQEALSKETDIVEVITFIRQLKVFFDIKRKKGKEDIVNRVFTKSRYQDVDQDSSSDDDDEGAFSKSNTLGGQNDHQTENVRSDERDQKLLERASSPIASVPEPTQKRESKTEPHHENPDSEIELSSRKKEPLSNDQLKVSDRPN